MESIRIRILTKTLERREIEALEVEGTFGVLFVHESIPHPVELNLTDAERERPWSVTHGPTGSLIANVDSQIEAFAFAQTLWAELDDVSRHRWRCLDVGSDGPEFRSETPPHVTEWIGHVREHGYVPLVAKQSA